MWWLASGLAGRAGDEQRGFGGCGGEGRRVRRRAGQDFRDGEQSVAEAFGFPIGGHVTGQRQGLRPGDQVRGQCGEPAANPVSSEFVQWGGSADGVLSCGCGLAAARVVPQAQDVRSSATVGDERSQNAPVPVSRVAEDPGRSTRRGLESSTPAVPASSVPCHQYDSAHRATEQICGAVSRPAPRGIDEGIEVPPTPFRTHAVRARGRIQPVAVAPNRSAVLPARGVGIHVDHYRSEFLPPEPPERHIRADGPGAGDQAPEPPSDFGFTAARRFPRRAASNNAAASSDTESGTRMRGRPERIVRTRQRAPSTGGVA
ncbi:hypothetical protein FQA39_LY18636 [Lamprigera yunnana]|nr:hypothetical protein FQA39_LY18636 [Lamprigera yunnana]